VKSLLQLDLQITRRAPTTFQSLLKPTQRISAFALFYYFAQQFLASIHARRGGKKKNLFTLLF
jgi:hypothetical protein